jgi:spore coat protein H
MTKRHWLLPSILSLLLAANVGCNRSDPAASAGSASVSTNQSAPTEDLFTNATVWRIEIEIPKSGMSALRHTQWGEGDQRPTAKATVKEDGVVYNNVAVHLKGAAGSFRPVDDRPAMTLKFDKFVAGQSFHGLHKISLNNSVQDPSFLSEKICRELFDQAGVPVPRAGHALVKLNGRDLGLYVLLEGANKQFLKRYFKNTKGNLFDGGFVGEIDRPLSVNSGDNPRDDSGLTALAVAARQARHSNSLAPLEKVLDVDRFLSMMAMEVIVCHWDGYALNHNNWRIFHDLDSNKMVFIPHGIDQSFGVGQHRELNSITPPMSGLVAKAMLSTREGRKRYSERVGQLYTNVFRVDRVVSRIDEIEAGIRPALAAWNPSAARNQAHQAEWLKQRVVRRAEDLRNQLGAPLSPLRFGSDGLVRLTGWKPSSVRSGDPILTQGKDPQGRTLLCISVANGASSGSWRTRVSLAEGQYRLEGRVRVKGVVVDADDMRGGAGLRISKGLMPPKLTGTADWQDFKYEFQVEDDATEVELLCELKASKGEAWFDPASLRLLRLQ